MATVSGVPVENISSIKGVAATSISNIVGVPTNSIPGWPGSGPTCTPTVFGYSDGRRFPPSAACTGPTAPYDFDTTNGILYNPGGCGSTLAAAGYYSGASREIFFWDGVSSFTFYDMCPR
jgi:hypothetical protein